MNTVGIRTNFPDFKERCPSHLGSLIVENDWKQRGKRPTVGVLLILVSKSALQLTVLEYLLLAKHVTKNEYNPLKAQYLVQ